MLPTWQGVSGGTLLAIGIAANTNNLLSEMSLAIKLWWGLPGVSAHVILSSSQPAWKCSTSHLSM